MARLVLALCLLVPALPAGAAAAPVPVGIGDQSVATFADPLFARLDVPFTRLVVRWDAVRRDPAELDGWLAAARAAGARPLVAFSYTVSDHCDFPCVAPGVAAYERAFRAFRARYPWVRDITPWNEANHQSQPTFRFPERAAAYYGVVRRLCRGCRITAADLLDSSNMEPWLRRFLRAAPGRPRLWGLHNYVDVNRFRTGGTDRLLRLVKGQVWLTETGGITELSDRPFGYDERRAARATAFLFRLADRRSRRVKRVYLYQWRKTHWWDAFDAGLVRADGSARPGYWLVARRIGRRG
jgi:hypothetical protein